MKLWIFLALVSINFACVAKVKVDVFYESLCPDSIRFISEQLQPLYAEFRQHLDVTLIPFGKSSSFQLSPESPIEFDCQHGPDECFGNKVQGCMLSRIADQDTMQFNADRSHRACVEAFGVSWDEILQCVQSDFATNQQLGFEQITAPVLAQTKWVPTIAYNGKINELSHSGRAPPLKKIICDFIYNTNPACKAERLFHNEAPCV